MVKANKEIVEAEQISKRSSCSMMYILLFVVIALGLIGGLVAILI